MEFGDGFGKIASLLCAATWGTAVVLFRISGQKGVSPLALGLFKGVLVLPLYLITLFFVSDEFGSFDLTFQVEASVIAALLASGVMGIAVSESLYFRSLNILGAQRNAIVQTSYAPIMVLTTLVIWGEELSWIGWGGAALIVCSLLLAAPKEEHRKELSTREYVLGVALALGSVITIAASIVPIKPVLNEYPPIWTTTVRVVGGVAFLLVMILVRSDRKDLLSVFRPQKSWKIVVPAAVVGSYVSMLLWVTGMTYTQMNISALLNQSATIFTLVLAAIFLKERMGKAAIFAAACGVTGAVMVLLESGS
jgi:drug/metabolite transporter (DMT)-like permease